MQKAIRIIVLMLVFGMLLSLSVSAENRVVIKPEQITSYVDGSYRYFQGIVYNKERKSIKFVKIKLFFYDRYRKLLRIEDTYTDPYTITPKGKATYTFMIDSSFQYKTYRAEASWSY